MAKTQFQRKLEARIKEAVDKRGNHLISGGASDFSQYKEDVGYILGLMDAIKLCEEIEAEND
jgi:hypothetical protein